MILCYFCMLFRFKFYILHIIFNSTTSKWRLNNWKLISLQKIILKKSYIGINYIDFDFRERCSSVLLKKYNELNNVAGSMSIVRTSEDPYITLTLSLNPKSRYTHAKLGETSDNWLATLWLHVLLMRSQCPTVDPLLIPLFRSSDVLHEHLLNH